MTIKDFYLDVCKYLQFYWASRLIILIVLILSLLVGWFFHTLKQDVYVASSSYIVSGDESKGTLGGINVLMGQLGISGQNGVYNYERIRQITKSGRVLKSIFSDSIITENGDKITIAEKFYDVYLNQNEIDDKNAPNDNRDSILNLVIKLIQLEDKIKDFDFETTIDDNSKIISTRVTSLDLDLSVSLASSIFENLSRFYNNLSRASSQTTLSKLNFTVDSLERRISGFESIIAFHKGKLGILLPKDKLILEKYNMELIIAKTLYAESKKNLETSKLFSFNDGGNYFTLIDGPRQTLRLVVNSLVESLLKFGFLGMVFTLIILTIIQFVKNNFL